MDKNSQIRTFTVDETHHDKRLDVLLTEIFPDLTRSYLKKLIIDQKVTVDNCVKKPNSKLHAGQKVSLIIPPPEELHLKPENIELDILYEDDHLLVINKSPGIVVHPSPGHTQHTLVNALLYHVKNFTGIGGVSRPGIVHRLDKDTSGCLVVAKTESAYHQLVSQFKNRKVMKKYIALAGGVMPFDSDTIEVPVGRHPVERKKMSVNYSGRNAVTVIQVKQRFAETSLLELTILTGRTHQIRVHLAHLGHPVLGDATYGNKFRQLSQSLVIKRQLLHAWKLAFTHPENNKWLEIEAPLPDDMKQILKKLKSRG